MFRQLSQKIWLIFVGLSLGFEGATGLLNYYNMLRRYFDEVQPTLVVLGFYLNDFQNSPWRRTPPLPGYLGRSWLLAHVRHTLW